jgi:hypothetical protein
MDSFTAESLDLSVKKFNSLKLETGLLGVFIHGDFALCLWSAFVLGTCRVFDDSL